MIGLHRVERGDSAEIGYWMAAPARGHGYLTEAARAVIDFAFDPQGLDLKRLEWRAVVGNVASARAARTLGFRYEGLVRQGLERPARPRRRLDRRTPRRGRADAAALAGARESEPASPPAWKDDVMPEMPEVQGLVDFLSGRVTGLTITRVSVANIAALKTYDPPVDALKGAEITGAARHGKFVDLSTRADADRT